jgi:SAM-dependent methyltransferase
VPGATGLRRTVRRLRPLGGSASYWERRYRSGGTSGAGSYAANAQAKAIVVNRVLQEHSVRSVVELGCGDGNQLTLLEIERYAGLDVSPTAIDMCARRFADDTSKSFLRYDPAHFVDQAGFLRGDLSLSQEVIFHLVEDDAYERYMRHLFGAALRLVLICSTDHDGWEAKHVRHRRFTEWVARHETDWSLLEHLPSPLPVDPTTGEGLAAEFFLYARSNP